MYTCEYCGDSDEEERNERALIRLALDEIDRLKTEAAAMSVARASLKDRIFEIENSTCACCHAKFGAKPIFSDSADMNLPGDASPPGEL